MMGQPRSVAEIYEELKNALEYQRWGNIATWLLYQHCAKDWIATQGTTEFAACPCDQPENYHVGVECAEEILAQESFDSDWMGSIDDLHPSFHLITIRHPELWVQKLWRIEGGAGE